MNRKDFEDTVIEILICCMLGLATAYAFYCAIPSR